MHLICISHNHTPSQVCKPAGISYRCGQAIRPAGGQVSAAEASQALQRPTACEGCRVLSLLDFADQRPPTKPNTVDNTIVQYTRGIYSNKVAVR